jgi:hypothetical protein
MEGKILKKEEGLVVATSTSLTLQRWSRENTAMTLPDAIQSGATLQTARKENPEAVNAAIIRELRQLAEALEVKVTFRTAIDYEDGLEVVHTHYGLKLEEVRTIFAMIRRGELAKDKLYERFKARELRAAIGEYMELRAKERTRHQYQHVHGDIKTQMLRPLGLSKLADELELPESEPRARRGSATRLRDILATHGKEAQHPAGQQGEQAIASETQTASEAEQGQDVNEAAQ